MCARGDGTLMTVPLPGRGTHGKQWGCHVGCDKHNILWRLWASSQPVSQRPSFERLSQSGVGGGLLQHWSSTSTVTEYHSTQPLLTARDAWRAWACATLGTAANLAARGYNSVAKAATG